MQNFVKILISFFFVICANCFAASNNQHFIELEMDFTNGKFFKYKTAIEHNQSKVLSFENFKIKLKFLERKHQIEINTTVFEGDKEICSPILLVLKSESSELKLENGDTKLSRFKVTHQPFD